MKAITLWDPWATAMALGLKRNETRSWQIFYKGDLAICAAKRRMTAEDEETADIYLPSQTAFYPGHVLCVVELFDCVPSELFRNGSLPISSTEAGLGNYESGRLIWRTRHVRRLQNPVPVRGQQGLFELPLQVLAAVQRQLPAWPPEQQPHRCSHREDSTVCEICGS